jgi:dienelactone hydrolase
MRAVELCLLGLVVLGLCPVLLAQEPLPGLICEKVTCRKNADQSYAVYLPSNYTPKQKWPILYALDPGARGVLPVRCFKAAAEQYGYIVAGSNNSQNGPARIADEALRALFLDTEDRFYLDSRRIYTAGFSGGARVAIEAAALMKGRIAGVIGFGAGYPPSLRPEAPGAFAFFGAAGLEDFNFPELRSLDVTLEKLGYAHRFDIFSGGHDWPPEAVCSSAVEWLDLQAMKSGLKPKDLSTVDRLYSRTAEQGKDFERRQEFYRAYQVYSAGAKDFSGLREVGEFETKAGQLGKSVEVRKALDQEKAVEERQGRLESQLNSMLAGNNDNAAAAIERQSLIQKLDELKRQSDQTKNEVDRLVALRVLSAFWIQLNGLLEQDFERIEYARAVRRLELMAEMRPRSASVFFHLGRAQALAGDRKRAVKALIDAVARGFKNAAELRTNPDFERIRGDAGFQKILAELEKNAPR